MAGICSDGAHSAVCSVGGASGPWSGGPASRLKHLHSAAGVRPLLCLGMVECQRVPRLTGLHTQWSVAEITKGPLDRRRRMSACMPRTMILGMAGQVAAPWRISAILNAGAPSCHPPWSQPVSIPVAADGRYVLSDSGQPGHHPSAPEAL